MNRFDRTAGAAAMVALFATLPAMAAGPANPRPLDLVQAMELVGSTYPGRVIAAQADPIGGDRSHHHVDMLLANGRVAKFDVDAVTRRIYNRLPPEEAPASPVSIGEAAKKAEARTGGRVVSAEYDPDPAPHYHVAVRLPKGKVARIDVDAASGAARTHAPRT